MQVFLVEHLGLTSSRLLWCSPRKGSVRLSLDLSTAYFNIKHHTERHQEVLSTIYSYLSLLRLSSLPSWNQEEIQALSQISFRFKEKQSASSYVSRLSELAARPYPREKILSAAHISVDWDESYVQNLLNTLTADRNRVMVMAREGLEELGLPEGEWSKEKWYGTEFKVVQMSKELIEKVGTLLSLLLSKV